MLLRSTSQSLVRKGPMRTLKRTYNGMPVRDAKARLTVVVIEADVTKGTRKDPSCCAFAQACKRLFQGDAVFFKKIAYITLPDENGEKYVHRYHLTQGATDMIMEYDRTGKFPAGVGVNLLPPAKSSTLNALRKYHYAWADKRNAMKRANKGKPKRRYDKKEPRFFDKSVRNGTGSMHLASFRVENGE